MYTFSHEISDAESIALASPLVITTDIDYAEVGGGKDMLMVCS